MIYTHLLKALYQKHQSVKKMPFLIGITGASGAGKSTLSLELLQAFKACYSHLSIYVIAADNFIYPNAYLKKRELMHKKGFPESFNGQAFQECIKALRAHDLPITMPVYSQVIKDIDVSQEAIIPVCDVYIIEGVNLYFHSQGFRAADNMDWMIFLDTPRNVVKTRALERFWNAYLASKENPTPYFEVLKGWPHEKVLAHAEHLWETMDNVLFEDYIKPYRDKADYIWKI